MFKDIDTANNLALPSSVSETIANKCIECDICVKECAFLSAYGKPGEIAKDYKTNTEKWLATSFECSLCGLCESVCPKGIEPCSMFLEFRKEAFKKEQGTFKEHQGLVNYESKGISPRYSLYHLPENCDTVFFPGCSLPGTRPETTFKTYEYLSKQIGHLGVVLDCCTKPSHDLGRQDYFDQVFGQLKLTLLENEIKTILVACPNCHKIFNTYGNEFEVKSVYEIMAENGLEDAATAPGQITIHDPCPTRFDTGIHEAVRSVIEAKGLEIIDTKHEKKKTLCCGEGGAVGCLSPEFASSWTTKRINESHPHKIASYCAGCVNLLSKKAESFHILDLAFYPDKTLAGKASVSKAPFTYLNRLKLKKRFQKIPAKIISQREGLKKTHPAGKLKTGAKIGLVALVIAAIAGLRMAGIQDYFDQDKLSLFIQNSGNLAPLIYILIYTFAPALFLPGLPITIVGGILFGPVWGVVYSIVGSTMGAGLAFLISRYVSSGIIESKLTGPKWIKLQDNVEVHGWKVVALTRLIPLFPFNLLNYAFGLTRIKFSHYIVTTFICMLPACIAFVVFSSSLVDLFQGQISKEFIIGFALILLVSLFPVAYKFFKKKEK